MTATIRKERDMPGKPVHVEIPALDTAKAREFWSSLFGWEFQQYEGPVEYHMTQLTDQTGGAVYNNPAGNTDGMRVYFDVDDINEGTARVRELGGEAAEPVSIPGMGWAAGCKDAVGNDFGLWQSDPSAAAPTA
jgi:predicted enzyme related to lactoylglutathione lyase